MKARCNVYAPLSKNLQVHHPLEQVRPVSTLARELVSYVAITAGSAEDLDEELEAAGLETWDATA